MQRGDLQAYLLGPFRIHVAGEDIPPARFGGRLVRTLLRVLLVGRGDAISRDVLADALWGGEPPADAAANLKVLVSRARRALPEPGLIVTTAGGYAFSGEAPCLVDTELFNDRVEAALAHLAAARPRDALEAFTSALAEWHGEPLLEDAYAEWAQEPRRRLWRRHLEAVEGAAAASLALGATRRAVEYGERAVAQEPLREAGNLLLVEALARSADAAGALRAYDRYRRALAEELGVDPSPAAADLQLRILQGRVVPALVSAPIGPATRGIDLSARDSRFVGRARELGVLTGASGGEIVLVRGHTGTGKTRLLTEAARRREGAVLTAAAVHPDQDRPLGLASALLHEAVATDPASVHALSDREAGALASLLPDLGELRPVVAPTMAPDARRSVAMRAAATLLRAVSPSALLVIVDDAQWADASSLELLAGVQPHVPRMALAVAYRPEALDPDGTVVAFVAACTARGARALDLGPLPAKAVEDLVDDRELAALVCACTDRTALAVDEALRALAGEGLVGATEAGRWRLPPDFDARRARAIVEQGQHRAILRRYAALPPVARTVALHLALLAREAPVTLVAAAASVDRTVALGVLDRLVRAQLVGLGEAGWRITHDAVAAAIHSDLRRDEWAGAHSALAAALQASGADPAEIAQHLLGAGDPQLAAVQLRAAARARLDAAANAEARRLADAALALSPPSDVRVELLDLRAEARRRQGELEAARADLRDALRLVPTGPRKALLLSRMAMLTSGADDYEAAQALAEAAVVEAGHDDAARAEALTVAGILDVNAGRFTAADDRLGHAAALFEREGDVEGVARVLDARGMAALLRADLNVAHPLLGRAAQLFLDVGNLIRAVSPLTVQAAVLAQAGHVDAALVSVDDALSLCRDLGQREDEAFAMLIRAQVLLWSGRLAEALVEADAALSLARALRHREWTCHALWVLGHLRREAGDLDDAEQLLRDALVLAEGMPVHLSLASSHLARTLVRQGRLAEARTHVARALAEALPLTAFDAHLAQAELAAAAGDADASALARVSFELAERGGYRLHQARLRELAAPQGVASDT